MKEVIKDFEGRIIGYEETLSNGDVKVSDFSGRILGYYRKSQNKTVDFYGRTVARGNHTGILLRN